MLSSDIELTETQQAVYEALKQGSTDYPIIKGRKVTGAVLKAAQKALIAKGIVTKDLKPIESHEHAHLPHTVLTMKDGTYLCDAYSDLSGPVAWHYLYIDRKEYVGLTMNLSNAYSAIYKYRTRHKHKVLTKPLKR